VPQPAASAAPAEDRVRIIAIRRQRMAAIIRGRPLSGKPEEIR
jgi:hypothetical protein